MDDATAAVRPARPLDQVDDGAVAAIHEASMEIVEDVGIQLDHPRARERFSEHGASVDDGVVTIPADLVEECVEMAPPEFVWHARNPDASVRVGGEGGPVRAPAYGPVNVRTVEDGRHASTLADYETLLKLAQVEDVITATGYGLCEPNDVDESGKHFDMLARGLELTDQPVMGPTYGADRAAACMDVVGIAVGDRDLSRPYVAGLINTVPPRRIGEAMLGGLLTYAAHGQPLVVSSFTMAGASGPPTVASSLALSNAENLVGIALAQLVNPGTPVVYGVPTAVVDGRYGSLSIGGPESAQFAALGAQMARFYGLPSRGGGALTDAKAVDYQAGFESTFLQSITGLAEVDLVLHAAGTLESYATVSPEKFVLDCESIRYVDRFSDDVPIAAEDFRLEDLRAVEPGGYFLAGDGAADPTVPPFHRSDVVDKRSYGAWDDYGGESAAERGVDVVADRLEEYERPDLPDDVARELDAYLRANRRR